MSRRLLSGPRAIEAGRALALVSCCAACILSLAMALASTAMAEPCSNSALRTGPSASLPDCRAYEMVTPPFKDGFAAPVVGISADGSHVEVEGEGVFAGAQGSLRFEQDGNFFVLGGTQYQITREASGWSTMPVTLPTSQFTVQLPVDQTADLSDSLWAAATEPTGHFTSQSYRRFYLHKPGGAITEVGPLLPPQVANELQLRRSSDWAYRGASDDLSHVIFETFNFHWPGDATPNGEGETPSLYEYVGTGNAAPRLVGVNGGAGSTSLISDCGTQVGFPGTTRGAISGDGRTVFFTALACAPALPVNELFARIDNEQADAHTVAISEPSAADCPQCDTEIGSLQNAEFKGASSDGSKVFFTTSQPLLGGDANSNLYEYDFAAQGQKLLRISGGDGTAPAGASELQSVAGVSKDGSHVYFVAKGKLTSARNALGQEATAGSDNLYAYERDSQYPAGRLAFVVTQPAEALERPNLSVNGRFLVFNSSAQLTPDDTSTVEQAFEYDAQSGVLVRVSIGEHGFNDNGNTDQYGDAPGLEYPVGYGLATPTGWNTTTVTDDGAVFFTSSDGLTVHALDNVSANNTPGRLALNLYEYEHGEVFLITDGQDAETHELAYWVDSSGQDVFFTTYDRLLPQDGDTQADVYDARVGGGFAPPAAQPPCTGDACQGALSPSPVLLSPGSEFQAGGGNLAAPLVSKAPKPKSKPKPLTRAQKLSKALHSCHAKKHKQQRVSCEAKARRAARASRALAENGGRS